MEVYVLHTHHTFSHKFDKGLRGFKRSSKHIYVEKNAQNDIECDNVL